MRGHGLDAVRQDELAFERGPIVEHGHGAGAECRLEVAKAVVAELGAVAHEQGLAHKAGIANPAEQAGGHECFPAAGRDRHKGAGGLVVLCGADDLLEGGAHSGVLVVAEIVQALLVRDFEQFEGGSLRIQSANRQVALNEFLGCGKLAEDVRLSTVARVARALGKAVRVELVEAS